MKIFWLFLILTLPLAGNFSLKAEELRNTSFGVDSPAPDGSRQHNLSIIANDKLLFSWVEEDAPENLLRFSILAEKGWSKPHTIMRTRVKLAAAPQVHSLHNGSLVAAWMVAAEGDDDYRYAADIYLARSNDGGQNWSTPIIPYSAQARVYDAQMSLTPFDNELILVWTDIRNLKRNKRHQLMMGVVDQNGKIGEEWTIDEDVCSCCSTSITAQGNDWMVAYRDRLSGDVRDISLARLRNGERTKKIVHNDHWVISGCPSNGPNVAWQGSQVMVTWFSAADGVGRVRVKFSRDNGKTFGPLVELDSNANGYVSALLHKEGFGIIAWRGRAGPEEELRVARVWPNGKILDKTTLYRGDFPRWPSRHLSLAQSGHETYVAWTDLSKSRVRLAKLPSARTANRLHAVLDTE